MGIPGFEWSKL